jgi:2-oxoglutarate/2-oxoacid ferredoxin oxidoreductase subunit beta
MEITNYVRERFFPHLWCSGCGHGIVLNCLLRAIDELKIDKNDIVMSSGIGCSSRICGYVDVHTLHTLHGRALAFATGVKMSRPNLKVIVPMGDGDATAIGGNHFIHACRRNIDMTAIIMNNNIYGMTAGQYSPLSGRGRLATTAPYGKISHDFDAVQLALGAGATYVARTTVFHAKQLIKFLSEAIEHKGFSVVEVLSPCPTYFGRKNKIGGPLQMMDALKDTTVPIGSPAKQENPKLIERGVFKNEVKTEYCEEYDMLIERVRG